PFPLTSRLLSLLPPRFPLFPYTTLFRSLFQGGQQAPQAHFHRAQVRDLVDLDLRIDLARALDDGAAFVGGDGVQAAAEGDKLHQDRKSTRLNSSHVSLSYAVFCLKTDTI